MKVLMINVVCGIRSTGRICIDLASALEAKGHEVKIAYGREKVPEKFKKYAVKIGTDFDVKVHGARARLLDSCGFGSKRVTEKFIKWVKNFDPDVIHLHNIHGYYINIEILFGYLKSCNKRIIWTLHDCWAFTGHSTYCDAINCKKWVSGCDKCPQITAYPKSYIDRSKRNWNRKKKLFTNVNNLEIVTPSKWLARLVSESFLNKYCVTVIHNGIDTTQFYPLSNDFREFYHLEGKFIILAVADTWNTMKGLDDYIELSNNLDDRFKIVLVGLEPKQIESIPKKIIGLPRTASTKELAMMYSTCDVFLNLTYVNTDQTVNIEAKSCGAKIITYDTGGSLKSVEKIDESIIIPKGDVKAVEDAVKWTWNYKKTSKDSISNEYKSRDYSEATNEYVSTYGRGYFGQKQEKKLIGKKIVLAVSALWDVRKGLTDVITIARSFSDDYRMVVIGVNDKQAKMLPDNIIVINRTNDVEELRMWYSLADVYINPTYEDNYPTTNLESIACGTPAISYDTGGSGESAILFGTTVGKADTDAMMNGISENYFRTHYSNIDIDFFVDQYCVLYETS